MISDDSLLKASVILSVTGIAALFALSFLLEPQKVTPDEITSEMIGNIVEVSGVVDEISIKEGNIFITLGVMRIVMFKKQASRDPVVYDIENGNKITVRGKVSIYKGELEVIAEGIKRH